jgi:hypothetical protein
MSKVFEEIATEASQLSRQKRFDLASLLLELNEGSESEISSVKWEEEILARIQAFDDNEVKGISLETVMRDAEDRLRKFGSSAGLSTRVLFV